MNTKKLIGLACWFLAFLIPFQSALLSTEEVSNVKGLISFVAMLVLLFAGYMFYDGANANKASHEGHGH